MRMTKMIASMAKSEPFITEDAELSMVVDTVSEIYSGLPETPTRMGMPAEQVPIASYGESFEYKYGIGVDVFGMFMEHNNIKDIGTAMDVICRANGIQREDTCIVFESDSMLRALINESRGETNAGKRAKKLKFLEKVGHIVQTAKEGNINVAKEPDVWEMQEKDDSNIINIDAPSRMSSGFEDPKTTNFYNS